MSRSFQTLLAFAALSVFAFSQVYGKDFIFRNGFEQSSATLIHRWSFSENGGSGTSLNDDIGGANGTIIEVGNWNAWTAFGQLIVYGSKQGGAQATSDYASLPAGLLSGLSNATIEIWATQVEVLSWARIFDVGDSSNNSLYMTWDFDGDFGSDRMQWSGASGQEAIDGVMAPYVTGTEYQIVMTIEQDVEADNTSIVRLYRDGVFQGERKVSSILADLADGDFLLARSRSSDPTASCSYNEIRIYDGVLSDADIAERFLLGPLNDKAVNTLNLQQNIEAYVPNKKQMNYLITSTAGPIDQGVSWQSSKPSVAHVDFYGVLHTLAGGTSVITATSWADPSLTASTVVTVFPATTKHFWKFSEVGASGTNLWDYVGGRVGQLVRVGTDDSSVGNGRVSLSGGARDVADYVNLGDDLTHGMTDFTIETWASTSSPKAWSRIFDFGPDTSNNLFMSWTQFDNPATDRIEMRRNGVTAFTVNDTMAPYGLGVEHHIVMKVLEGASNEGNTVIQWFLDGVYKGGATVPQTWSDLQDTNNWLGRSKYPDETANATYNEFRIYEGGLTYAEIQENFANGPVGGGAIYGVSVSGPRDVDTEKSIQLTATVNSTAGEISQTVSWNSDTPGVAIVDPSSGVVTGLTAGTATIRATSQAVPSASRIHSVRVRPVRVGTDAVFYSPVTDQFIWFKNKEYTTQTWGQPHPESTKLVLADWPAQWGSDDVDASIYFPGNQKVYLFKGSQYARFSIDGKVDAGYPKSIVGNWAGWPSTWGTGDMDAAVYSPENDKIYLFKGQEFSRATWNESVDSDFPRPIAGNWSGWPESWGEGDVDAATYYPGNKKFYLFKEYEYIRHGLGASIDSRYPEPFDKWKSSPPQVTVNPESDLIRLPTSWSTQQWDGIGFPDSWSDSRGLNNHIQGVTRVYGGRWVLSHSRDDDPGFLIYGKNSDFKFLTSSSWGDHPGSIQATGSVVAIPFSEPQEVRFVHFGANGPVELTHLKTPDIDVGLPNSVGIAYYPPHQAYYMIIGITTNRTEVKDYPMYKSHFGKSLMDPTNRFERMGTVEVEGSETGMQLANTPNEGMYLFTLYRGDGDGLLVPNRHRAVLSKLTFPATVPDQNPDLLEYTFSSTEVNARQNFDISGGLFTDPSFRFGAGVVLDENGYLGLIATERCIPPLEFWMQSCQGDGDGLDYFILKSDYWGRVY